MPHKGANEVSAGRHETIGVAAFIVAYEEGLVWAYIAYEEGLVPAYSMPGVVVDYV
ncbi:hypothetical protein DPMN_056051, partial [Dreissena polymorpha]